MSAWASCVGDASWMSDALQNILHYDKPLPVQQAVVPTVSRALLSGVPMDVSLTAPTGSGKTLCYALPMLRMVANAKRGADDIRLRALILVPTHALGQQVQRELQRLTRHTSVAVVSLCGSDERSAALVRRVRLPRYDSSESEGSHTDSDDASDNVAEGTGSASRTAGTCSSSHGDRIDRSRRRVSKHSHDAHSASSASALAVVDEWCYFSLADILIATPQRLLRHLDHTTGLRLASLRLLIIDEADQVLANNFANFVAKVVDRFDAEVLAQQRRDGAGMRCSSNISSASSSASRSDSAMAQAHALATAATNVSNLPVLHKMICSATLSSRIARISEVRLRNCRYYALDSHGQEVSHTRTSAPTSEGTSAAGAGAGGAAAELRCDVYALPPTLQEHILFVEDEHRHAVLLKLVRRLLDKLAARRLREREQQQQEQEQRHDEAAESNVGDARSEEDYPPVEDNSGNRIMIFCNTAEEARVTGHFLSAAGVEDVVEFTTAVTEAERRRALLGRARVVVASDALMRGIDVTDVGHVILYHAPQSVAQYVHRAGRTARAMRCGHLHLLLCKAGPSGGLSDGEVAQFKLLSASVQRSLPVRMERHFFRFAQAPSRSAAASTQTGRAGKRAAGQTSTPAAAAAETISANEYTPDHAEWWIAEANQVLERSQLHLQRMWLSAMDAKQVNYASQSKPGLLARKSGANERASDRVDAGSTSEEAVRPAKKARG